MGFCLQRSVNYIQSNLFRVGSNVYDGRGLRCKTTSAAYVAQRIRDPTFEKFMDKQIKLLTVVTVQTILLGCLGKALPAQYLFRLQNKLRLKRGAASFLKKHVHIFDVYRHPIKGNLWFRLTNKATELVNAEDQAIRESEHLVVERLKKLLMISTQGALPLKALLKVSRPLGFPDDFEDSIITKKPEHFYWIRSTTGANDMVGLVSRDPSLAVTAVEKWRNSVYTREELQNDKEIMFIFKHQYPPGFRVNKGYREKVKKWQKLSYWSPYEDINSVRIRSKGGIKRLEKRAVSILHEFLSLTVEKMVEVEQISHFRKCFDIKLNIRDLFLDHPGIFYLSSKRKVHTIFLREGYRRGRLLEPNSVYILRQKMSELAEIGRRGMHLLQPQTYETIAASLEGSKNSEQLAGIEEKEVEVSDNSYQSDYWDSDCGSTSDSSEDGEGEEWNVEGDVSNWSETYVGQSSKAAKYSLD